MMNFLIGLCLLCNASISHEIYLPKGELVPQKDRNDGIHMQTACVNIDVLEYEGIEVGAETCAEGFSKWQDFRGRDQLDILDEYKYSPEVWNTVIKYSIGYRWKRIKVSFVHEENEVHYSDKLVTQVELW